MAKPSVQTANASEHAPLVSVVIPTLNRRLLLERTIESLRAQTYSKWEAVVIDDGSSDDTDKYMATVCHDDPRLRFFPREGTIHNANVCRNQGFKRSVGDYVIFLDSDDLLAPYCLEQRVKIMERNPDIDFAVFPGMCFFNEPGDSNEGFGESAATGDVDRLLAMDWAIQTTGPIWRRDALLQLGLWDESLLSWQDVDFHLRALISSLRMLRVEVHDYYIRVSRDYSKTSVVQESNPEHLGDAVRIFKRFKGMLEETNLLTRTRGYLLAGCYLYLAERQSRCGLRFTAYATWREALRQRLIARRVYIGGIVYLSWIAFFPLSWLPLNGVFKHWKWKWRLTRGNGMF